MAIVPNSDPPHIPQSSVGENGRMRSPLPTPGRNNRLENLWQRVSGFLRSTFTGSRRPLATQPVGRDPYSVVNRNYDLEISEYPVRDAGRATQIIELCEHCPEAAAAIGRLSDDCVSSVDGDDLGFNLSEDTAASTPEKIVKLDPQVLQIGREAIARCLPLSDTKVILERMLSYGDCFCELSLDMRNGMVTGLMPLPTWEMFRVEPQGELLGFQQRRSLWDEARQISFVPPKVIHWRYRRKNLYGRPLFFESRDDWQNLKEATWDLASAAHEVGVNPTVHTMPDGADPEYRDSYALNHQAKMRDGIITHYYLMPGEQLAKLSNDWPDLKSLSDTVLLWRSRIVMKSGVPPYLLGLPAVGAQDISGQPALAYSRFVNAIRGCFTEGVIQLICTELALRGYDPNEWRPQLKIVYPKIAVTTFDQSGGTAEDEDAESDEVPDTEETDLLRASNGHYALHRHN